MSEQPMQPPPKRNRGEHDTARRSAQRLLNEARRRPLPQVTESTMREFHDLMQELEDAHDHKGRVRQVRERLAALWERVLGRNLPQRRAFMWDVGYAWHDDEFTFPPVSWASTHSLSCRGSLLEAIGDSPGDKRYLLSDGTFKDGRLHTGATYCFNFTKLSDKPVCCLPTQHRRLPCQSATHVRPMRVLQAALGWTYHTYESHASWSYTPEWSDEAYFKDNRSWQDFTGLMWIEAGVWEWDGDPEERFDRFIDQQTVFECFPCNTAPLHEAAPFQCKLLRCVNVLQAPSHDWHVSRVDSCHEAATWRCD